MSSLEAHSSNYESSFRVPVAGPLLLVLVLLLLLVLLSLLLLLLLLLFRVVVVDACVVAI